MYNADFIVRSKVSLNSNLEVTSRVERLVGRIYQDQDKKIQEFEDAFQKLRDDLDTGMLHQAVVDTSKTVENTNIGGTVFGGAHDL